jgi:hypothetical protein
MTLPVGCGPIAQVLHVITWLVRAVKLSSPSAAHCCDYKLLQSRRIGSTVSSALNRQHAPNVYLTAASPLYAHIAIIA